MEVLPVDLGYGPSTLFPAQGGTPVYTAGDQVWAMSHFNATIQVRFGPLFFFGKGTNSTSYSKVLEPEVPARLLTINSSDPQGLWNIAPVNSTFPPASFVVSDASAEPANLTLSSYRLGQGRLEMSLATSSDLQMYGASACIIGGGDPSVARIPLPPGIGAGYVNVSRSHNTITAIPSQGRVNYSLSVELWRSISFLLPGSASTLVSRMVQVAASESVLISGGESASLSLRHDSQLRPGTYQVRAIFEGEGGVFLSSAEVIIIGSSGWVWRGACSNYPVYSNDFTVATPLGPGPGSWPRSVWLTYEVSGVQGVAYLPLKVNISAVNFVGVPWGVRLAGYSIRVESTSGVEAYDVSNGTVFAVLDASVGQIWYEAGPDGDHAFGGTAGPLLPFASTQASLNVSKLAVQYFVAGTGFEGGRVSVSDSAGVLENATTGVSGMATFYLPAGRYNVTATGGNSSAAATTNLTAGRSQVLVLGGTNGTGQQIAILAGLGFAAVIGAMANAVVWVRKRMAPSHGRKLSQK